jgi:hypothetical protein
MKTRDTPYLHNIRIRFAPARSAATWIVRCSEPP